MSKKNILIIIISILLLFLISGVIFVFFNSRKDDNILFAEEYEIDYNNVFVYKNAEEIIKILEHGTGIVYLGFPECPWCKAYVKYLNEVAIEEGVEKIYYFNILEDRKNNTKNYQKIISLLNDNLMYDEEGNKRIYVPDVSFVLNGKIIFHDNETSVITTNITPDEYWTGLKVEDLKEKLRTHMKQFSNKECSSCDL